MVLFCFNGQSAFSNLPLTHTYTPMATKLTCNPLACPSGATWELGSNPFMSFLSRILLYGRQNDVFGCSSWPISCPQCFNSPFYYWVSVLGTSKAGLEKYKMYLVTIDHRNKYNFWCVTVYFAETDKAKVRKWGFVSLLNIKDMKK